VLLQLVEPLGLLPPLLLQGELRGRRSAGLRNTHATVAPEALARPRSPHLLDLVAVLRAAAAVDAEALLEHGHAGLGLAALDLGQPALLLLLLGLQDLDHPLVVALHLLLLLEVKHGEVRRASREGASSAGHFQPWTYTYTFYCTTCFHFLLFPFVCSLVIMCIICIYVIIMFRVLVQCVCHVMLYYVRLW